MTADFWSRVVKIAFVDGRATIALTITSVELENAVGVATVRRNVTQPMGGFIATTQSTQQTIQQPPYGGYNPPPPGYMPPPAGYNPPPPGYNPPPAGYYPPPVVAS